MEDLIKAFLQQRHFAVAGSFRNPSKVAYRILGQLRQHGYIAYPVNPKLKEVDGVPCYQSVKDIPASVEVVDIVTPPAATEQIVKECKEKGIRKVWLQPGAESEVVITFCNENGIEVVFDRCIMIELKGARP